MQLIWKIEKSDIENIRIFIRDHEKDPFVKKRIKRNLESQKQKFSKEHFFYAMVTCLLTTQQRSGPGSAVYRFTQTVPFQLSYSCCTAEKDIQQFCEKTIKEFGGIRRHVNISKEIEKNLRILNNGFWNTVEDIYARLLNSCSIDSEREAANQIRERLIGFGPKQSRNLLQILGLTRYEIPIDSRVIKWLNQYGFPVYLTSTLLSDQHYYNFIMDGIQQLCQKCEIYPCILDAAIFSSFDEIWPEEFIVF